MNKGVSTFADVNDVNEFSQVKRRISLFDLIQSAICDLDDCSNTIDAGQNEVVWVAHGREGTSLQALVVSETRRGSTPCYCWFLLIRESCYRITSSYTYRKTQSY